MTYSGPFNTVETKSGAYGSEMIRRSRYRQKPPYVQRLPYSFSKEVSVEEPNPWGFNSTSLPGLTVSTSSFPDVYSKAYGKFIEESRAAVNLAVDIAERKQAVDMIARRCMQTYRFARLLSQLRFAEAARELNLVPLKQKVRRRYDTLFTPFGEIELKKSLKAFGNNYLEFHFGWEPLVKDVGDAVEMLHDTPFAGLTRRVEVSATGRYPKPRVPAVPRWSGESVGYWPRATIKLIADVRITDPNIARLNQLGFVNPAVIAWELVPFSFVVDWFTNIGQVLSAYTDDVGFAYDNAATTVFAQYSATQYWNGGETDYGSAPFVTRPVYGARGTYVTRTLGISTPKFTLKPVKWPSVTRGLTASALLTQFLRAH